MTALQLSVLLSNLGDTEVRIKRKPNLVPYGNITDVDTVQVCLDDEAVYVYILEK